MKKICLISTLVVVRAGFFCVTIMALVILWRGGNVWAEGKPALTSLDWPPYTGEKLKDQGPIAAVAKAAFKAAGMELKVEFFPWSRAVDTAKKNPSYFGYFPEYYAKSTEESFVFSNKLGEGPLGFVERADAPVAWETLTDLKGKAIGIVQDYVNTADFDRMAASGELTVDAVTDDLTNIRKVLAGRILLAVIDKNVLEYLLASEAEFAGSENKLQFNKKILENKELFICFRKDKDGERMLKAFNEGLAKVDAAKIAKDAMDELLRGKK